MCACQAGGLVGGPVKTQVGKDALAAVVAKKVSADMKMYINASRDAITRTVTSHGISGAVLFWAFAVYWLASKGTNLAQYLIDAQYRKWKSKNARKSATWHDLIS